MRLKYQDCFSNLVLIFEDTDSTHSSEILLVKGKDYGITQVVPGEWVARAKIHTPILSVIIKRVSELLSDTGTKTLFFFFSVLYLLPPLPRLPLPLIVF